MEAVAGPVHGGHAGYPAEGRGWAAKNAQLTCVAENALDVEPMIHRGRYCGPPGHVCPAPASVHNSTAVPAEQPVARLIRTVGDGPATATGGGQPSSRRQRAADC